ncbi:4-coumarate--CoA ligase-like 1-like [Hibiscus syriacus]|uniref:4-coumarate--CoA ligase-like 1-like n=1 Tax=Hibiscus syriacus TaxID=106335 RepID=A0A6A3BS42_HIBSY|nr:4-coumarate--CoA ligase-like 1-like [Hibiscus syriacus]
MVVAQKAKETDITEQDSLLLTRNLLRIAIFNISYIRGLFPENYFNDKSVPALGVYDALQKKYLKTLLFCICESIDGAMIEEYSFSFSYSNSDSQEVSMNINRTGNRKQGKAFKCNSTSEVTPNQMSSACKMVRTLVQLMRTLDKMPKVRTILMKLLYYDDVTPVDYEPPFFRGCTEDEAKNSWTKNPLRMEVGNVNSKHFLLALKVKSVLDPSGDENDDIQDEEVSISVDSVQRDESSDSDSEVSDSQDEFIVAPVDQQRPEEENSVVDEDNTEDPMENGQQLERVKNWINNLHLDTIALTDVLSIFPDISVDLTEEIMDKLVKEGVLSSSGKDNYVINKQKKSEYEFPVKEEMDGQVYIPKVEDHMYMKALYHALPMTYVSAAKLQKKLDGQVNQNVIRKIINKMTRDGFVEAKGNRRLVLTNLHLFLLEQDMDINEPHNKTNHPEMHTPGSNLRDMSTFGALHSIGSDLTRMRGGSDMNQSEQTISKNRDNGNTPISMARPIASRESTVNRNCDEVDHVCSRASQDKRGRKASTVKEPILQNVKRQKSQAP